MKKEALKLIESSDKLLEREFRYIGAEKAKEMLRERAKRDPKGVIKMLTGDSNVK